MKIYRLMECMDQYEPWHEVRAIAHSRDRFDAFIEKYKASISDPKHFCGFWVEEIDTDEDTSFIEDFMKKDTPVYETYPTFYVELYRLDDGSERIYFRKDQIRILKDDDIKVIEFKSNLDRGFKNTDAYLNSKKRDKGELLCYATIKSTSRKAHSALNMTRKLYVENGGVLPTQPNIVVRG